MSLTSEKLRIRSAWHYRESGQGPTLILLHGIGMSHAAWTAVTPHLNAARRVIAFDIPGFGLTPPLPNYTPPTIANLVESLNECLYDIGIDSPVDFAGNSLGGCMALEAARRGIARSVGCYFTNGFVEGARTTTRQICVWRAAFHGDAFPESLECRGSSSVASGTCIRDTCFDGKPSHARTRCTSRNPGPRDIDGVR